MDAKKSLARSRNASRLQKPRKSKPPKRTRQPDHSAHTQRQRIERALRDNPRGFTTIELVERFDVMRPGARIHELRWEYGLNIKGVRVADTTAQGSTHSNVVRYLLLPGRWQGGAL